MAEMPPVRKPRCFLVYALAPDGLPAAEANRVFNEFVADRSLPLAVYHDHFIGRAGGVALFYVENGEGREALYAQQHLIGWALQISPLIFSYSPAAFDEQIAFTLRQYRDVDWQTAKNDRRPAYGRDVGREAETATEV